MHVICINLTKESRVLFKNTKKTLSNKTSTPVYGNDKFKAHTLGELTFRITLPISRFKIIEQKPAIDVFA